MIDKSMVPNRTAGLVALAALAVIATGAEIPFSRIVLDENYIAYERDVGDMDGDGRRDVVAVQEGDTHLQIFRAPDWRRATLVEFTGTLRYPRADDLKVANMEGDGDLDIVTRLGDGPSSDGPGVAVWCENLGGGKFARREISPSLEYVKDIVVTDFDQDRRLDVAMRMDSRTQIWLREADGAWSEVLLQHPPHEGMEAADLDMDGRPDLVMNGFWFAAPRTSAAARDRAQWRRRVIDERWFTQSGDWTANSSKVAVGDFDGDGCNDVVLSQSEAARHEVAWYRSAEPLADRPWERRAVAQVDYCHNLQAADFDLDGQVDLLVGGMIQSRQKGLTLLRNAGRGESWAAQVIQDDGSYSAELGDIDDDGDLDIVGIRNWNSAPSWIWRNETRRNQSEPLSHDRGQGH